MYIVVQTHRWRRSAGIFGVAVFLASLGCGKKENQSAPPVSGEPVVRLVQPVIRDLLVTVGQPSFVDSYEQTAIYAKLPGYVEKWNVDIGDRIQRGQLLAQLSIPELEQELHLKQAQVVMDKALVDQSLKLVDVANGNLKATIAQVTEAKANVGKAEALVERWQSEVKRQNVMVADRVLDLQILGESKRQLEASVAARDAAQASVLTAEANQIARTSDVEKAKVDVQVARARLKVGEADEKRVAALYGYTQLTAPYDGIVVLRNANTGDFVLPATGDPSATPKTPDQSASRATPVYVVARTDIVRVYVDVPESMANAIVSRVMKKNGDPREVTSARVRVNAFSDFDQPAEVTRSSWSLNFKSRTLRAEIDLHNPDAKLLPGMYAFGSVEIKQPHARVLPKPTVTESGNQTICYVYEDGRAKKLAIQTRLSDGTWIEVLKKQVAGKWEDFSGKEDVILGDLSDLSDGQKVQIAKP